MSLMDRWEAWKTTRDNAAKVPALEERIAELEALLNGKAPAEYCERCGERSARMTGRPFVQSGMVHEDWLCGACNGRNRRIRKP